MTDLTSLVHNGDQIVVIAEAGVNHNGDETIAHELIDVAAMSGAHFVKFQTFDPDKLVSPAAAATPYQQARAATERQSELLRALTLPDDAWKRLRTHAQSSGIGFLSTPFDDASARLLVDLGVDAVKLSSGELTNTPFLRRIAALGLPMLVSTGMGSAAEVATAVECCSAAPFLALFHCVSAYPAPEDECNLRAIPTMATDHGVPVGWSDHTTGLSTAIAAAALGARLFEKHFTLDRTMDGPDHAASLEPDQLLAYVSAVMSVPTMLGDGVKRRMPSEEPNAPLVRRSWHAAVDLVAGSAIADSDVVALRPEGGLAPSVDIIGRVLVSNVRGGYPITDADLEPQP